MNGTDALHYSVREGELTNRSVGHRPPADGGNEHLRRPSQDVGGGAIDHVLASATVVDEEAAHTGRSRIVAALGSMGALDPALTRAEAENITYTCLSFEVARVLTVERGWSDEQYEMWIGRSLSRLLLPAD
ncbi:MAG: hypothetical protein H0U21_08430 [Acidimicrobiia bacterium]|nr:hypothetical protein [Acidimicrobiia bacterium]